MSQLLAGAILSPAMIVAGPHINLLRAMVIWVLRAVALILIAIGGYLILKRVLFGLGVGDLEMAYMHWMDIGESHSLYRGLAMMVVGIALGVFSARLSRWIVTVPLNVCPRCGHAPTPGGGNVCAECGYAGIRDPPGASGRRQSPDDRGD